MNTAQKKKTLFIIDHDDANRREICSMLADEYCFIEQSCVSDAIAYLDLHEASFCAVLLSADEAAGILNGFFMRMQATPELSSIPVLLTASSVSAEALSALGQNAVDCITKPYHPLILKNRIHNAIQFKDSMTLQGIEKMLKELPSNIYLKDRSGRYVFATHYWHHLEQGGDPNWTIRGKTDMDIRKDKENAKKAMQTDQQLIENKRGTQYTIEVNMDGTQQFLEIIKQPIFDADGNVDGIIALINDVTEHELLKKQLEIQARTDELTRVYNRTYFYEYLRMLPEKNVYPVSIISSDCDNLKTINDTYGHMIGDHYIQMTVHLFRSVLPENSVLFRLGGDEFTALLPCTPKEEAAELIQKMRASLHKYFIRDQQLSVSFGLSALLGKEDSVEMRIAESDQDMYREKRGKHAE